MLTLSSDRAHSVADVAARLTDEALELVGGFGISGDSVEMELHLWRVLMVELMRECTPTRFRGDATLGGAMKRAVNRATLRVIAERPLVTKSRALRPELSTGHLALV
jgi:hypothetical protein